jgi:hypothetical protein
MVKRQTNGLFGTLYTVAILGLGYKFILKYNKYQLVYVVRNVFNWDLLFLIQKFWKN